MRKTIHSSLASLTNQPMWQKAASEAEEKGPAADSEEEAF